MNDSFAFVHLTGADLPQTMCDLDAEISQVRLSCRTSQSRESELRHADLR